MTSSLGGHMSWSLQLVAITDDFLKIKFIQKTMNVIYTCIYEKPCVGLIKKDDELENKD